jgi:hypothetical protein
MARIRTIKPELLTHIKLQDFGFQGIVVFAGLIMNSDKNGVFPWKPEHLKLAIAPWIDYDINQSMEQLQGEGMILKGRDVYGKYWGIIPTFRQHQHINKREADQESRYPSPEQLTMEDEKEPEGNVKGTVPTTSLSTGKGTLKEHEGNHPLHIPEPVGNLKGTLKEHEGGARERERERETEEESIQRPAKPAAVTTDLEALPPEEGTEEEYKARLWSAFNRFNLDKDGKPFYTAHSRRQASGGD